MKISSRIIISPFKYLLIGFLFFAIIIQLIQIDRIIIPINGSETNNQTVEENLKDLGAPKEKVEKIAKGVRLASDVTNLQPELIVAVVKTESNFDNKAISKKKYKGLMQTPSASFDYVDVDILHGAYILKDKLRITNGDLLHALTLYKGGNNPQARRQAKETLDLYQNLVSKNSKRGVTI